MRRLSLRLGLGPLALGFALSLSRCGGGGPTMYAYADEPALVSQDDEPALVSLDEGNQSHDDDSTDDAADSGAVDSGRDDEQPEVEGEVEQQVETETSETEPQVEGEGEGHEAAIEQTATTEDVIEHIDQLSDRLDAVVDLLMISAGSLGAVLGTIAFGKLWGPLAGER